MYKNNNFTFCYYFHVETLKYFDFSITIQIGFITIKYQVSLLRNVFRP